MPCLPRLNLSGATVYCLLMIAVLVVATAAPGIVRAQDILLSQFSQSFGKNKIQYKNFQWWKLKTEHLEIYYNPEYLGLALSAAEILEDGYEKISRSLHHDLSTVPPIIIFQSHYEFEQTNIVPYILPPGVGGFAESLKFRAVIPFNGDLEDFRSVLVHELTHLFQYDILYKGPVKSLTNRINSPPTWIMEGMAQYEAGDMNDVDEMVLRDAVLTNTVIPIKSLDNFQAVRNVFLAYKQSHSLMQYISQEYGEDKVGRILRDWKGSTGTGHTIKRVLGTDIQTLSDSWSSHVRRKYWPLLTERKYNFEIAKEVPAEEVSYLSPSGSLGGEMLAVVSTDGISFNIDLIRVKDGELMERITEDMKTSVYTDLKVEEGCVAWSPDGQYIAFIARKGPSDLVLVWNVYRSELMDVLKVEGVQEISTLAWAPDNRKLAFSGSSRGQTDIYILDIKTKASTKLMHTADRESQPSWSPDGSRLAFSYRTNGSVDLMVYDFELTKVQKIVSGKSDETWPRWFPDGARLLFVSNRDGINDLFVLDLESKKESRLTKTISGLSNPSISPDGKKITFASYYNGRRKIYVMDVPSQEELALTDDEKDAQKYETPAADGGEMILSLHVKEEESNGDYDKVNVDDDGDHASPIDSIGDSLKVRTKYKRSRYKPSLQLDGISAQLSLSNNFFGTVAQISFSDLMGNHNLGITTDFVSGFTSYGRLNDLNFAVIYGYYGRRTNLDFGIFSWTQYFTDSKSRFLDLRTGRLMRALGSDRQSGLFARMTYPIDLYRRVEFKYTFVDQNREFVFPEKERIEKKTTHLFQTVYVNDSVEYGWLGPSRGKRFYLSAGQAVKFTEGHRQFTHLDADLRFYAGRNSVFAFRLKGLASLAKDGITHFLGGPNIATIFGFGHEVNVGPLRGFDFSELAGTRLFLMNMEYRVPFVRNLTLGWPGNISLGGLMGTVFTDVGVVWNEGDDVKLWTTDGEFRLKDLKMSMGLGIIVNFILPINIEFAKETDLRRFFDRETHFSFGLSF